MLIEDSGIHSFPDDTLEVLSRSTAQQLKKKYTSQTDPFLIEKDNKLYIFYEALSFHNSEGTLRCHILDRELAELEDIRFEGFDDLKCHLSFPYLIHVNDQLLMIPEFSEGKGVILFRSIEFPARWKQVKVLIFDTGLTSNIFVSINKTYYLLSTTMDDEIVIHSADHIYGQQQRIIPSLKVSDPRHRGVGTSYLVENKIYFLTQECTPKTCGESVYIRELVTLDDADFAETLIEQIDSSISHSDGVRTLNFSDSYIVCDTKMDKFSLLSILKEVSYKCIVGYHNYYLTKRNRQRVLYGTDVN